MDKIICFEGIDGSFKETNTKSLYNYIKENISDKVVLISFPDYRSASSYFVRRYLNGDYGELNTIDAYTASSFYALDRYDTLKYGNIDKLISEGYYIILDRYVGSNLCYQSAKIKSKEERDKFIDFQYDFEYNKLKLPKPAITLFMSVPIEYSIAKLKERKITDIHESNIEYLKTVKENSLDIVNRFNWKVINSGDKDNIYSKEKIFESIINALKENNIF